MKWNPNKTESIRELGNIDISKIRTLVHSLGDKLWQLETKGRENEFDCFHHTEHIVFRFPDQTTKRTQIHDNPSWQIWKPYLMPLMEQAVKPYGYKNGAFKAVMLAKLKAGYGIDKHRDGLPEYYYLHKIHIPILTNDKVDFYIKPDTYQLEEGKAYEVNNIVPHAVMNNGNEDRIHLIFEYMDEN
jgi:hypothetical protein